MNSLEQKIQNYGASKSPKSTFQASRSLNPDFPHVSKFEDVTRYNSANHNVYFYKDYPNRQGTPIKAERKPRPQGYRRSVSPKKQHIIQLIDNGSGINDEVKQRILQTALEAQIRTDVSPPQVKRVAPGPAGFTMNDFHKRETNAGYARNGSGGFYTR
ncbi:hypothetical protein SteCoe_32937 [Stentor coeruleus]|uniref:Uncharacterized protein n=1 Tax=Stentor coeruleus TaxID=5963 RepID=A0A1R2AXW2_9CILI|nr:hypothetical protein SteCoe_32937 [Stentor coeruleus]